MKFLLFALAVFGVAQAAVIQPKSLVEALDKIKAAIPTDKVIAIIQSCEDDPEVKLISDYLRKEFPAVVEVLRNDPELQAFAKDMNDLGVSFDWINHLLGIWGIDPIEFGLRKDCGGWRGVYDLVQEEVTFAEIIVVISQVYDDYPEFAKVWDRISAADKTIQRLLADPKIAAVFERLAGLGVDLERVKDSMNGIFGWTL